jgi:SAM-dependent methyltransferase
MNSDRSRNPALTPLSTSGGRGGRVESEDAQTAAAFATSWNTVGDGSVYTREQFLDWLSPVDADSIAGTSVLELGFGNGSLLYHVGAHNPSRLAGVELGDTHEQTRRNLQHLPENVLELHRDDLTKVDLGQFDLVYCIGVLHHLADPEAGFLSVLRHTKPGGRFHCWVYAKEGNDVVIHLIDPLRRVASRLPWWFTKYAVALPLALPYYAYAKLFRRFNWDNGAAKERLLDTIPLGRYTLWIAERDFSFFHHVAFDQLVTPQTCYLPRSTIDRWLGHADVDSSSVYVVHRNGNSWKFGGRRKTNG